jgi:hypothetical protein
MPSFFPFGKAGGLQILRFQGFAVANYGVTLSALALEPSDFCNVRGTLTLHKKDGKLVTIVL